MNKILCILPLCTNATNKMSISGDDRIKQYINGLNRFFEYSNILKENKIDIYLVDNSTNTFSGEISNIIPDNGLNIYKISIDRNIYGKINKGAGLIDMWRYMSCTISRYDFLIHFEPRQLLIDFSFINTFLTNKRNLFTYNKNSSVLHFNTGLFCINCNILLKYINSINIDNMIYKSISIEYDLHDFIINNNIEFDIADKMNLIWYPFMVEKIIM